MPHLIYMTVLSLVASYREVQNFAEEEQNTEVIEEPTVQPGNDSILTFKLCIYLFN